MRSPAARTTPLSLLRDPEFVALASARFARGIAFATIIIALALYADEYAASGIVAGLFGTAYALARFFLVLPVGRLADVGNSKRWLLIGLVVNALVLAGFTRVGAVEHVVLLRALQGGGSALLIVTTTPVIGQICPDDERGLWLGTASQVKAVSSLSGDMVGGALLFLYGFRTTYLVMIAITAVAAVFVFSFLRDDPGARADPDESGGVETIRRLLSRRAIRALVVFRFAFSFGKMAVTIFLPIFARTAFGMSPFAIGGILAGGRVTKALAQGYVGSVSDRVGGLQLFVAAGAVVFALGTALIPFAGFADRVIDPVVIAGFGRGLTFPPAFFALFGAYVILGVADSLRVPTSMTLFVEEGEHYDAVAASISLRSLAWQVGAIAGPFAVGAVLDYGSFFSAFWLASGFVLASSGLLLFLYAPEPAPGAAPADD